MIKVGHNDPEVEVERVAAVRAAVGDKILIIPDANQGWTPQVAIQCIRKMEAYHVAWVEQPRSPVGRRRSRSGCAKPFIRRFPQMKA